MDLYYIQSKYGVLCSNNSVKFDFWNDYSTKEAQRKIIFFAWLKAKFIQILWRIQGDKEKIWIKKI